MGRPAPELLFLMGCQVVEGIPGISESLRRSGSKIRYFGAVIVRFFDGHSLLSESDEMRIEPGR